MGANGLKIYKSLGMSFVDSKGNRIKVNDPRIDPVWAKCGELDMMEYLGHQPSVVYGTVHWDTDGYKHMGSSYSLSGSTFSSEFHVFSFIWTPNNFKWLVDGYEYYKLNISTISGFPINLPQFFIFNVAVGGNWPGNPDETTTFPQHMIVDYIRVYQ